MTTSLTPEEIAAGWVAHDGNGCPVEPMTNVSIRFRDGDEMPITLAVTWACPDQDLCNWTHSGGIGDIIAYRVLP